MQPFAAAKIGSILSQRSARRRKGPSGADRAKFAGRAAATLDARRSKSWERCCNRVRSP